MAVKDAALADLLSVPLNGPRECRDAAQAAVRTLLPNLPELTFSEGDYDPPLLCEAGD